MGKDMKDKGRLMAAIMGAIAAFVATERQPPMVPQVKPQPEASRQQHNPTTHDAK